MEDGIPIPVVWGQQRVVVGPCDHYFDLKPRADTGPVQVADYAAVSAVAETD